MYHLFDRVEQGDTPAGITVSKNQNLPDGDFGIIEHCWGDVALWFVTADNFTADERQSVYLSVKEQDES